MKEDTKFTRGQTVLVRALVLEQDIQMPILRLHIEGYGLLCQDPAALIPLSELSDVEDERDALKEAVRAVRAELGGEEGRLSTIAARVFHEAKEARDELTKLRADYERERIELNEDRNRISKECADAQTRRRDLISQLNNVRNLVGAFQGETIADALSRKIHDDVIERQAKLAMVRETLGADPTESTLVAAKRVVDEGQRLRQTIDLLTNERDKLKQANAEHCGASAKTFERFETIRKILDASGFESAEDAAKRTMDERHEAKRLVDMLNNDIAGLKRANEEFFDTVHSIRKTLQAAGNESAEDAAKRVMASLESRAPEVTKTVERDATIAKVRGILGALEHEFLADAAERIMIDSAEAKIALSQAFEKLRNTDVMLENADRMLLKVRAALGANGEEDACVAATRVQGQLVGADKALNDIRDAVNATGDGDQSTVEAVVSMRKEFQRECDSAQLARLRLRATEDESVVAAATRVINELDKARSDYGLAQCIVDEVRLLVDADDNETTKEAVARNVVERNDAREVREVLKVPTDKSVIVAARTVMAILPQVEQYKETIARIRDALRAPHYENTIDTAKRIIKDMNEALNSLSEVRADHEKLKQDIAQAHTILGISDPNRSIVDAARLVVFEDREAIQGIRNALHAFENETAFQAAVRVRKDKEDLLAEIHQARNILREGELIVGSIDRNGIVEAAKHIIAERDALRAKLA